MRQGLRVLGAHDGGVNEPKKAHDAMASDTFIHLLYAPTNFCNLACTYCYLGNGTDEISRPHSPLHTLARTVDRFLEYGVTPFNISLHGGEPTAIPKQDLEELFAYISGYYEKYGAHIKSAGMPLNPVHIKTNLYNFHQRLDIFNRYKVSVSASVDLPLSMHAKYRVDKRGGSTVERIEANLRILARYPHHKKISCVMTQEHLQNLEEFAEDILKIHKDVGLDMNKFNIMFSFDSTKNLEKVGEREAGTRMLNQDEQLEVFLFLTKRFEGTELHQGLKNQWFKEFTSEYCCSAMNCGNKFFLLQENGNIYSCPRGQSSTRFKYGNVFSDSIEEIMSAGWVSIEEIENTLDIHTDCHACAYLPYCNVGCTFVRAESGLPKSYTCKLQKELYRAMPHKYPPYTESQITGHARVLRFKNNIKSFNESNIVPMKTNTIASEAYLPENSLATLIAEDEILGALYSPTLFEVVADGVEYALHSPVLANSSALVQVRSASTLILRVRRGLFSIACKDEVNNHLHLMLLRNTMVTYGDENRTKQEHIADYSIYAQSCVAMSSASGEYWEYDLMPLLRLQSALYLPDIRNNLLVTSKSIREYHYAKQKKNAFYHIQAINLPFQQFEFYWKE